MKKTANNGSLKTAEKVSHPDDARDVVQGTLFGDSIPERGSNVGFPTKTVVNVTGLTQRQLDNWDRTGTYKPSLKQSKGSGSRRYYSFKDIVILKVYKQLLDQGLTLQKIKKAVDILTEKGVDDIAALTLVSDGATVYDVTNPEEIYDVLKRGAGVFAISIAPIWQETEGVLHAFPGVEVDDENDLPLVNEILERQRLSNEMRDRVQYRKKVGLKVAAKAR